MKKINIKDKLVQIGVSLDGIVLGDFDVLGEVTAKRTRSPDDPNYKKVGAYYRSNYERGILIYYLIRQFNLTSMLEIGFGRGYSTFCAAKAFYDAGINGKIVTVDPNLDENYIASMQKALPQELFKHIAFARGRSQEAIPKIHGEFDLVYIDGDHSYAATASDWQMTRNKFNKFMLFDDYHLPTKKDAGIQCSQLIDEINPSDEACQEPELIILDRRIFFDDRRLSDDQIDYGQVLFTKLGVTLDDW